MGNVSFFCVRVIVNSCFIIIIGLWGNIKNAILHLSWLDVGLGRCLFDSCLVKELIGYIEILSPSTRGILNIITLN